MGQHEAETQTLILIRSKHQASIVFIVTKNLYPLPNKQEDPHEIGVPALVRRECLATVRTVRKRSL
jgi:hypothetical protein